MQVVHTHCAGLDVHKKGVVACRIIPGEDGKWLKQVRSFGTMTDELLALADWLRTGQVTHVAMESTGVYTPPPMLPIGGGITGRSRQSNGANTKDNPDLLSFDLNPFDQGADKVAAGLKIGVGHGRGHGG